MYSLLLGMFSFLTTTGPAGAGPDVNEVCTMIPEQLKFITVTIVTVVKIVVPVLLIIFGMIDLGKAVVAQKEEDIKKGQSTLIKRAIAAIIVFFVITIAQLVFQLAASSANDDSNDGIWACVCSMVTNSESCKTKVVPAGN